MLLVIPGSTPALKNEKMIYANRHTGKPFVTASPNVKRWMKAAISELQHQFVGLRISGYPIGIVMVFYFDSKRPHDLDNAAASVMDALKHAKVIEDDSCKYVDTLTLQYGGIDKTNPRAEVYLDD